MGGEVPVAGVDTAALVTHMIDCTEVDDGLVRSAADPRVTGDAVRCLPGGPGRGAVLLVGVVHDHPASVFRVSYLADAVDADVLAVELPPLAVPLFRLYAQEGFTPPRLGGEMSAAILAAGDVPVVGIDGPNPAYLRRLLRYAVTAEDRRSVVPALALDALSSVKQAVANRLGAVIGSLTPVLPRLYAHIDHETTLLDSPSEQAAQEASHVARQRTFTRAIRVPRSRRVVERLREDSMAARIEDLRRRGDVLAVVGMEHLDPLAASLGDEP